MWRPGLPGPVGAADACAAPSALVDALAKPSFCCRQEMAAKREREREAEAEAAAKLVSDYQVKTALG